MIWNSVKASSIKLAPEHREVDLFVLINLLNEIQVNIDIHLHQQNQDNDQVSDLINDPNWHEDLTFFVGVRKELKSVHWIRPSVLMEFFDNVEVGSDVEATEEESEDSEESFEIKKPVKAKDKVA